MLTKDIIAALLFIISITVDKTLDRKDIILIRSYITLICIDIITDRFHIIGIRIDIITDRFHIIDIRIDIITDCICIFSIRFGKYPLCTDKDSPRSKSGTYARHTKANAQNQTLHNSQPCPTLLGHTLTIGNSFKWTNKGRTANIGFGNRLADGISLISNTFFCFCPSRTLLIWQQNLIFNFGTTLGSGSKLTERYASPSPSPDRCLQLSDNLISHNTPPSNFIRPTRLTSFVKI